MSFSIDGLVSGFDTSSIIESLLGFQQTQIDTFNERKSEITSKQTSYKGIEAQLLSLQSSVARLNRLQDSVFDVTQATSSDEDFIVAVADSGATNGSYQLTVESLATAEQIGSQGFSSSTEAIATGDLTIRVGTGSATVITVNEQNNTLDGLAQAINEQSEDVSAGIIFDQGNDSYRLLLTSKHTGESNSISVTNTLASGTGTIPDFSGPAVQEAQNAVVRLGSGPGAIVASYDSNTVSGLIEDVTLDLKDADVDRTITIDVRADTSAAEEAINGFVEDFNSVIEFIDEQTKYDPISESASPLLGDRSVAGLKNELLSLVSSTIVNPSQANRLSQIGIDINLQGKLAVDSNQLSKALNGELDGITAEDVRNLFGLNAESSNSSIRFLTGGTRTQASDSPYEIDITQAAEQAVIDASSALADTITVDGTNNELQITLDGIVSETLTLAAGDYTREEFAAHLESVINNSDELGVHQVNVSVSADNKLSIQSVAYGSNSSLSSISGSALSLTGFDGTENDSGQDVQGSFIVDGVTEAAIGKGRTLIGNSDNEYTADLQFVVSLTSDQVLAGVEGTVEVSRGVTGQLDEFLTSVFDETNGLLKSVEDDFTARIDSIDQSIERVEAITESKREYLVAEFTALETIISDLQNTGTFISTQLASIAPISANTSSK